MKQFLQRYLFEVAKLTMQAVDCIVYGMGLGLFLFSAFFVFASLYGWAK